MNERLKITFISQMQRIQDMIKQPKLSLWEINELYKHLGMMRMADIILRHDFQDESMHAKYAETEAALENAAKQAQQLENKVYAIISIENGVFNDCSVYENLDDAQLEMEEIAAEWADDHTEDFEKQEDGSLIIVKIYDKDLGYQVEMIEREVKTE